MIPGYIPQLLDKYGNAYVSPRLIAKAGGEEAMITKLRAEGYQCVIEKRTADENEYGSLRRRRSDDSILVLVDKIKERSIKEDI